jgi:carbonic anhydrase
VTTTTSSLGAVLDANSRYAEVFDRSKLAPAPARRLAVVACMDARLHIEEIMGLRVGDAHIIRNAGGLASDDAIRSLVVSYRLLNTREFFIVEHTGCGMLSFQEEEVKRGIAEDLAADVSDLHLHPFSDLRENLRRQVQRVKETPWIPKDIPVHGLIYHVEDGRLEQVV